MMIKPALLSGEEQQLVALVEDGLKESYPSRIRVVRTRPIPPDPQGWIELVILELDQPRGLVELAHEPVARKRITSRRLRLLSDSILFSVQQQLGQQRRN